MNYFYYQGKLQYYRCIPATGTTGTAISDRMINDPQPFLNK